MSKLNKLIDEVENIIEPKDSFGIGKRKLLLVIAGVSGSGKSYLEQNLVRTFPDLFNKWEQFTTRLPRPGEKETKPYIFVTRETFERFEDKLVGRVGIGGESNFGTSKYGSVPNFEPGKISTVILSTEGIQDLQRTLEKEGLPWEVCIFGIDADDSEIVQRAGRDADSLERERSVLRLADYTRRRVNGSYVVPDDVIKVLNEFFDLSIQY